MRNGNGQIAEAFAEGENAEASRVEQPGGWRIEDGVLGGWRQKAHLFSQRGDYENFRFRIEAKVSDGGNGGQCFRCPFDLRPGSATPFGYEAEINSTHAGQVAKTGSLWADDV